MKDIQEAQKKKNWRKGWEDKHRFHLLALLSKLQQQHEKEKTNWRCLIAGQTKYKLSTQSKAFFMLIWCKSGCQQPNPRLLGEQETGGAWWWIQMSCPDCSEAALEPCMCSSWGSLSYQFLQHRTGPSFLWHYHYDPRPQNHQLHPSLKK